MKVSSAYLKFILFALLFGVACKKTTSISGTVTNRGTNLPMEGVSVRLQAYENKEVNRPPVSVASDESITNAKGEYSLEIEACGPDYVALFISEVKGDKYALPVSRYLDNGDCKNVDLFLNPFDSYLKLVFENHYSYFGKVYCYLDGPALEEHDDTANSWPREVPHGQSSEDIFLVPGNAPLYIIWDTLKTSKDKFRGRDSITCVPNDTTTYVLRF